jgi:hypothetical protein
MKSRLLAITLLLLVTVACAMTPRQKFYMGEVAFAGAQSAAIAYLKTPYGQNANETVLTVISETSDEGTALFTRLRPMVPAQGEEVSELNKKLLNAGLDTMDSIIERLERTVFAPDMYEEGGQ